MHPRAQAVRLHQVGLLPSPIPADVRVGRMKLQQQQEEPSKIGGGLDTAERSACSSRKEGMLCEAWPAHLKPKNLN
eukprot:1145315-Pelagomonas_calceolata.AAC.3